MKEVGMVGDCDALVDRVAAAAGAVRRVAVAGEVLRGGQDPVAISEMTGWSLEPVDGRLHLDDELRVLTEALVGATPAVVLRGADARREAPWGSAGAGLRRRDVPDLFDQSRVAGGAQADVVREDGGPVHVAVPMDRVDAIDQGYVQPGSQCRLLEAVDHVGPGDRGVVRRSRSPAGQDAAKVPGGDGGRVVVDPSAFGLRHLADLLRQRHPPEQVGDPSGDWEAGVLVGEPMSCYGGLASLGGARSRRPWHREGGDQAGCGDKGDQRGRSRAACPGVAEGGSTHAVYLRCAAAGP